MKIVIKKNNIEQKIEEYRIRTGATKTWVAEKLGMSKQRLYAIFKSENMMLDVAIKFSLFLNCDVIELVEYEVIES